MIDYPTPSGRRKTRYELLESWTCIMTNDGMGRAKADAWPTPLDQANEQLQFEKPCPDPVPVPVPSPFAFWSS
jgi:hypothetical protein